MDNRRVSVTCAGVLALALSAGSGYASGELDEEGLLQISGDYRVVITQTCVRTPYQPPPAAGFDPNTRQLLMDGEMLTAIGSGLMRFAEDGTVQVLEGVQTEMSLDQLAPGKSPIAPPAQFTCSGNYTIQDRKVAFSLSCDVVVPQPGVKVTVGPQNFEGYIDRRKRSLNLTNITGGIQTVAVSIAGTPMQERHRICTQHALAIQ